MKERIALVTGANRGIGLEVVRQLSELGYTVCLACRDVKKGEEAKKKSGLKENIFVLEMDVSSDESVKKSAEIFQNNFPHLEVLVNNAAIHYNDFENIINIDMKIAHEALETNTLGPIRVTNAFLPFLFKSERGRIVNVSSQLGSLHSISSQSPAYNLSKAALNAVTCMYAEKLKPKNILVNSVCPGWTFTDMGKGGRPVTEGAKSVVWAVTIHDDGPTGGFFRDGRSLEW